MQAMNGFVNIGVSIINSFIDLIVMGLNAIQIDIPEWVPLIGGRHFGFNLVAPQIPYLAQGAVIPPNREFMAVLGDQKHGTNVEAPLTTIQEALSLALEDHLRSNLAGHEATLSLLEKIYGAICAIEIGDTVIGRAYDRYARDNSVMGGGMYAAY